MTVKIIYEETDEIGVPESAVTIQGETAFVYIVNNEIAEKKDINDILLPEWKSLLDQLR